MLRTHSELATVYNVGTVIRGAIHRARLKAVT